MKDGEPPPNTWFQANSIQVGLNGDLSAITSLYLEHIPKYKPPKKIKSLGKNQKVIMDLIENEISMEDLKQKFIEYKEEAGEKYNRQYFHKAIKTLEDHRYIKVVNEKVFLEGF